MLSREERAWLVEYVFRADDRYTESVKEQFRERFPNTRVPHRDTVRALISKLRERLHVMRETPSKSVRRLAAEANVGRTTAHKALRKELHLFPYKIMAVQELQGDDCEKRMAYCRWFKSTIAERGERFLLTWFR